MYSDFSAGCVADDEIFREGYGSREFDQIVDVQSDVKPHSHRVGFLDLTEPIRAS